MLGNFVYSNPTKLYFGKDSLDNLSSALNGYNRIMLVYGGGSIKKNGLYDKIVKILRDSGKEIIEDGGVMPNPTVEKLYEGSKIARDNNVDFILAVGGGSVITNHAQELKIGHVFGKNVFPKFAILNPEVTFTLPEDMIKGIADSTLIMTGGYKVLERDEVIKILRESM